MAAKSFGRLLLKALGVLAFCAVSAYALFLSYGYNYDLSQRHLQKTSIIDITPKYSDLRIFLDDRFLGNNLPFQIKDVMPGAYRLSIEKNGFVPWKRILPVQTDFVTKVEDVLLVPTDMTSAIRQLGHFDPLSRFFLGRDSLVVMVPTQKYFTLVSFLDKGTLKEEEIQLSRSNIQDISLYPAERFLVTFDDGTFQWINFPRAQFIDFTPPAGFSALMVSPDEDVFYFLVAGNLYRVPFVQADKLDQKNLDTYKVRSFVDAFSLGQDTIEYLSNGMLFAGKTDGKNVRLWDRSFGHFSSLFVVHGKNTSYLILGDGKNRRLLFLLGPAGKPVRLLTEQLQGDIFLDDQDRVLYRIGTGQVFAYQPARDKTVIVTQLESSEDLLGWFGSTGHFLFTRDGKVQVADLPFTNVSPLMDFDAQTQYFVKDAALFSLNNGRIKVLYWLANLF